MKTLFNILFLLLLCSFVSAQSNIYASHPSSGLRPDQMKSQEGFKVGKINLSQLPESEYQVEVPDNATVYLCLGRHAYVFHKSENCHDLKDCSIKPYVKTTAGIARSDQYIPRDGRHTVRTPCRNCYR